MKLICSGCFVSPDRARGEPRRNMSDLVVLSRVRYGQALAAHDSGEPLRCELCRGEIRMDGHFLSWYRR